MGEGETGSVCERSLVLYGSDIEREGVMRVMEDEERVIEGELSGEEKLLPELLPEGNVRVGGRVRLGFWSEDEDENNKLGSVFIETDLDTLAKFIKHISRYCAFAVGEAGWSRRIGVIEGRCGERRGGAERRC